VEIVKPDRRSREPCRTIRLTRDAAAFDGDVAVCIEAKSWKSVVFDGMVLMAAGTDRCDIDTKAHVTSLVAKMFDARTGEILDQEEQSLGQSINVGLTGQGRY
jgi:hypothetical protein